MVRPLSTRSGLLACAAAVLGLSTAPAATQARDYDEALPIYRERVSRASLHKRTQGREILASTRDLRAFDILAKSYAKPEEPKEFVRSLLVSISAKRFRDLDHLPRWNTWREKHTKTHDAWLWFHAFAAETRIGEGEATRAAAIDAKRTVLERATALRALARDARARSFEGPDYELAEAVLAELPARGIERALLLEGVVAYLAPTLGYRTEPRYKALLRAAALAMAEKGTDDRTRIVLSRLFARILERDNLGPDPKVWIDLLGDGPRSEIETDYALRRAALVHTFFGIPEHGRRVCFVIDASDSMLETLTPGELEKLKGPLTGGADGGVEPTEEQKAAARLERSLDWDKIKTRFDAAREFLKVSIAGLQPDQRFAVVLFGSDVRLLNATRSLGKPTKATLTKVFAELDAVRPGAPKKDRPLGTLMGNTNLHGGLLAAFQVGKSKRPLKDAWLPGKAMNDGVDTIYVLSDGAPSWDNWDQDDTADDETAGDPELGTSTDKKADRLHFSGPFAQPEHLLTDVERHNLIRRCAIHAVGLGEADHYFLERLTRLGGGRALRIGG